MSARTTGGRWLVESFNGRGARTAHLFGFGRRAYCGRTQGGGLWVGAWPESRRCGTCQRIGGAA